MTQTSRFDGQADGARSSTRERRIGVLVIAGGAPISAAAVLACVPERLRPQISGVFLTGGSDRPATKSAVRRAAPSDESPRVIHLARQRGDGDIQKAACRLAIEGDLDILVVLRGRGPYAPGLVESLVAPLDGVEFDAVIGVRPRLSNGAGETPFGGVVGSRILDRLDRTLGTRLSDLHSGWRAYRVQALSAIPFEGNAHDGHFDMQVVLQLIGAGRRIAEVPLPVVREEEVRPADALRRARDASLDALNSASAPRATSPGTWAGSGTSTASRRGRTARTRSSCAGSRSSPPAASSTSDAPAVCSMSGSASSATR